MSDVDAIKKDLLEAAQREAFQRGWIWLTPVQVDLVHSSGERVWSILTNAYSVGSNIRMKIRECDLAILEAHFLPR